VGGKGLLRVGRFLIRIESFIFLGGFIRFKRVVKRIEWGAECKAGTVIILPRRRGDAEGEHAERHEFARMGMDGLDW
jgi:hypothetical protein